MQDTKPYSIGAIIVVMIFFWPVGVYMIIANVTASAAQLSQNSATAGYINPLARQKKITPKKFTGLKVLGGILIGVGVICETVFLIVGLSKGFAATVVSLSVFFFVVFIACGVMLCCIAGAQAKKSRLMCRYVDIINNADNLSIASIGKQVGQNEARALKIIEQMLAQRYFPNCYIDREEMLFCFPRVENAEKFGYQTAVKTCPSCGAHNLLLVGVSAKCNHCGSPVKADFAAPSQEKMGRKTLGESLRGAATSATGAVERFMNKLFK